MSAEVISPTPDTRPVPVKKRGLFGRRPQDAAPRAAKKKGGRDRKNDILSRRNRWYNRLFRFLKWIAPWAILAGVGYWAYTDEVVLAVVGTTLAFVARLAFAMVYLIIQFVALFWFMSRSKVETLRPEDPKAITFDDYWGQPNLKRLVRQWISLLSDRDQFVQMGGQYINGLLLYGEPGTGKCVVGDTRIITPWGYHRIDEIHPARTPDSYWPLNVPVGTVDGVKTASHFYAGGKSKTLRVRTYHGYELEGTPEHPVLCLRPGGKLEWVRLDQLTTDDYVGIARNVEMWGPARVSEAYLLGILVGDGHILSGRRVELSTSDPEIAEQFKAWAEANGWTAHKASAEHDWYISSAEAVRRVNQMGLPAVLAPDKTVPTTIWRADRESVRDFLRGLFDAEGHADKDTGYVELASSSQQLAQGVQLLLLKFGIMSRVTRQPVFHRYKGVRKQGIAWKLTMAGRHAALFYERVGFGLARKQEKRNCLPLTPNPNDDTIPNIGSLLAGWQPRYAREERRPTYEMLERAIAEAHLQHPTLDWLLEKRPIWSRVESVTPGEAEVFDITVPEGHAFVANGFISHNTMLAKAMAGEAGVAFISMEGSGFRAMFWGVDVLKMVWFVGAARKLAREYGACIAYIDEIDAVGMSRGNVMGGGMGMMGMGAGTGALTRLLYEMDGIGDLTRSERIKGRILKLFGKKLEPRKWHVLFMGSTNRPDVLDPALLRPGRFDQMIQVAKPDKSGRREIITGYLNRIKTDGKIDIEALVDDTTNTTPAQIMSAITKDAVRIALFDGRKHVSHHDIEKAFQEQVVGIENPIGEMDPEQRRQVAYHEAGHAIAQHYLMPDRRIVYVSIVRRARGILGYVLPVDKVEIYAQPLRRIGAQIMVAMAGHVATKVFLGEYWTGAYSDFSQARAQIRHLAALGYFGPPVKEMGGGMLGPMTEMSGGNHDQAEKFWRIMEERVERVLNDHYDEVDAVAKELLEKNNIPSTEFLELVGPNSAGIGNRKIVSHADMALPAPSDNGKEELEDALSLPEPAGLPEPTKMPETVAGD